MTTKGETPTRFDKAKKILLNSRTFVAVAIVALGLPYTSKAIRAVKDIIGDLIPDKKMTMLVTVSEGVQCADMVGLEDFREASTLDIGLNNNTDRNLMLTSVELVPDWISGGFFAGELSPSGKYEADLSDWHRMAEVSEELYRSQATLKAEPDDKQMQQIVKSEADDFAAWCNPRYGALCNKGPDGLLDAGKARYDKDSDGELLHWWVKPEPLQVTAISGNKFTIKKGDAERILIHLGLPRSIDYVFGKVTVVAKTDAGDTVRSKPVKFAVCNP
jgi:hypothetical protein